MASFSVEVGREVRKETRRLPGNVRQRVIRALKALGSQPRPPNSQPLDVQKIDAELREGVEARRIRLESWRILYAIEERDLRVSVLAIQKRPPYRYDDLKELLAAVLQ